MFHTINSQRNFNLHQESNKQRGKISQLYSKKKKDSSRKLQYSCILVSHTCLSLLTFHPKVAFHIRLILSRQRESRSKIKFVAGNWRKKKNGLPNETISYFPLHAPLYNTRLSLNELREIPISIWLPCASSLSRSPSYYVAMMDH